MAVGFGPLARIDGPPPIPPMYGLIPAAGAPAAGVRLVPDEDAGGIDRWINGAQVYDYPPGQGGVLDACAVGSDGAQGKDDDDPLKLPEFGAVTVYLRETCSTYRIPDQADYVRRARVSLLAVESALVAREFMAGGTLGASPHLTDGNGDFPNMDVATSVAQGIAWLEQVIAASGKFGLIHCSPSVATVARERFAIDDKGGVLRTINGNVVIPDAGYSNPALQTPTGHAPASGTQEWMFCTGPIDIRRTEIFVIPERVEEAVQRGTPDSAATSPALPNSLSYQVERYYLTDWDTQVQGSVKVDRCFTTCTS